MIKKIYWLILFGNLSLSDANAQVTNSSYTTRHGEKVLQISIIVPMDKKDVWKLFTTDEGLQKWIAPVATINIETGGYIKTNYNKNKSLDDSSSIRLGIINYLEYEMLTLKINLNNNFPAETIAADKNLQEIIQFSDAGNGNTKIRSTMVGWGQGDGWDKAYGFFENGNTWTFKEILKLFEK